MRFRHPAGSKLSASELARHLRFAEKMSSGISRSSGSPNGVSRTPSPRVIDRRRFLMGAAATGAAVGMRIARAADVANPPLQHEVPADPTKTLGVPLPEESYGSRSQFEQALRRRYKTSTPYSSWTFTPLQDLYGIVTPSGLHFERSHAGTATIDPDKHFLYIHGMVEKPRKYSMADLKRFPSVSRLHFLECSGNTLTEWWKPNLATVQGTHGLTSTSEWTGVPLATLLREAGVKPGARWILAEGADAAQMTRSIPIEKACSSRWSWTPSP